MKKENAIHKQDVMDAIANQQQKEQNFDWAPNVLYEMSNLSFGWGDSQ